MFTFISVVLIILGIFVHEYFGHAMAIRKAGAHVFKIALGLPYGPSITFPLRGKWSGTDFVIHYLYPFFAFTEYTGSEVEALPYWQQSRIHASGPFMSLIFGYFLIILAGLAAIAERPEIDITYFPHLPFLSISLIMISLLDIILRFGGKIIFTYVVPFIPFVIILLMGYSLLLPQASAMGPVALINTAGQVSELSGAIFFAGNISNIVVGFPMLLPFRIFGIPLDGFQIIRPIVQKFIPQFLAAFESFGTMIFGLLILYVLQNDLAPIVLPILQKWFS